MFVGPWKPTGTQRRLLDLKRKPIPLGTLLPQRLANFARTPKRGRLFAAPAGTMVISGQAPAMRVYVDGQEVTDCVKSAKAYVSVDMAGEYHDHKPAPIEEIRRHSPLSYHFNAPGRPDTESSVNLGALAKAMRQNAPDPPPLLECIKRLERAFHRLELAMATTDALIDRMWARTLREAPNDDVRDDLAQLRELDELADRAGLDLVVEVCGTEEEPWFHPRCVDRES